MMASLVATTQGYRHRSGHLPSASTHNEHSKHNKHNKQYVQELEWVRGVGRSVSCYVYDYDRKTNIAGTIHNKAFDKAFELLRRKRSKLARRGQTLHFSRCFWACSSDSRGGWRVHLERLHTATAIWPGTFERAHEGRGNEGRKAVQKETLRSSTGERFISRTRAPGGSEHPLCLLWHAYHHQLAAGLGPVLWPCFGMTIVSATTR